MTTPVYTAAQLLNATTAAVDVMRALLTDAIAEGLRVWAWAKGSPTRSVYYGVAQAISKVTALIEDTANQGFQSTATGDALTLNIADVKGITRPGATYATTTVLISNIGGGNYPFGPRELILLNTAKEAQYVNLSAVTIGPLAVDVPVDVIAVEAGSASTALPGEIDAFVTPVDGLSITQANAAIGVDAMSDADLRAAGQARVGFVPTASTIGAGGAPGAYESVARVGPDGGGGVLRADGTRISVTRVRVIADGSGGVLVYVADEDGPIEAADLVLVDAAVKAYSTPTGIGSSAAVNAGTEAITATFSIAVAASSTATDAEIKDAATLAIVEYLRGVPIGGYSVLGVPMVPIEGLQSAVHAAVSVLATVVKVAFTSPAGDVTTIGANEVPILSGTPTITIVKVPNT